MHGQSEDSGRPAGRPVQPRIPCRRWILRHIWLADHAESDVERAGELPMGGDSVGFIPATSWFFSPLHLFSRRLARRSAPAPTSSPVALGTSSVTSVCTIAPRR